jgi:ankyrin repeat protein
MLGNVMPHDDFLIGCVRGDVRVVGELLATDASHVLARDPNGRTGLHLATAFPEVVRLLLAHGADPNAREHGDNVTPLHLAAAHGDLESVRILLDGGADVHGKGDLHEGDVIGWAASSRNQLVIDLLLERGARHHVFSAMALGDPDLVRRAVAADPAALRRRRSRFENGQTAVHAAFAPADGIGFLCGKADHDMLALLIELGADVHAADDRGRTPLTIAMLRGDHVAMRMLVAAGAEVDTVDAATEADDVARLSALSGSVSRAEPMFSVRDLPATVRWYESLGFTCTDAYADDGAVTFARLVFGRCSFALTSGGTTPNGVSLWVSGLVSARQLAPRSLAILAASSADSTKTSTHPFTAAGSSVSATPTTCP